MKKRLTRLETLTNGLNSMPIVKVENQTQANQKLFVLENTEEELGIDLVTLFRALTQHFGKVWVRWSLDDECSYIEERTLSIVWTSPTDNFKSTDYDKEYEGLCFYDDGMGDYYYFKDYGVTWALTEEELENENKSNN